MRWMGTVGTVGKGSLEHDLPSVRAQVREGRDQKRQEWVESRNKGTPVARERLPLLAAESAGQ